MVDVPTEAPVKLLCAWHVAKNLSKGSKKAPKKQQANVERLLFKLHHELDKEVANEKLMDFKKYISDPKMKSVKQWFESEYEVRFQLWAYCHRLHFGINTNMGTENLFSQIKMHTFKKKHVPRLDESIHKVKEFLENKLHNYMNNRRYHSSQDTIRYQNHKDAVTI